MSSDDSRAGNATRECASVWNRVLVEMRIVCLIAVSEPESGIRSSSEDIGFPSEADYFGKLCGIFVRTMQYSSI